MLDSGAFSVWNMGKTIDIYKYIEFIKENDIEIYFNLDVIGDVEGTKKNQKIMEDNGLNPIPVFHYGEPFEYLDWLVEQGYTYIGIGGTVGKSVQQREKFFNDRTEAVIFFMQFMACNCDKVCVENPVGYMNTHYRKPDQFVEPFQFGDPWKKKTGFWLFDELINKDKEYAIVDEGKLKIKYTAVRARSRLRDMLMPYLHIRRRKVWNRRLWEFC